MPIHNLFGVTPVFFKAQLFVENLDRAFLKFMKPQKVCLLRDCKHSVLNSKTGNVRSLKINKFDIRSDKVLSI